MAQSAGNERRTYRIFRISVSLKGANAFLEVVGGGVALLISPALVNRFAEFVTRPELGEDPHDFIARHLLQFAHQYTANKQLFAAFYLLTHGAVKFALVVGLLRNKLWAYPTSLAVFGLFVLYQSYLYAFNRSPGVLALTVFDVLVIWFIWREYRIVRAHRD